MAARGLDQRRHSGISVMLCRCWQSCGIGKKLAKYCKQELTGVDSPGNIEYFKFNFSLVN